MSDTAEVDTFIRSRFYRPREIIARGRAPRELVYRALHSGELKAIRRGNRFLVPGSAVLEWLAKAGT